MAQFAQFDQPPDFIDEFTNFLGSPPEALQRLDSPIHTSNDHCTQTAAMDIPRVGRAGGRLWWPLRQCWGGEGGLDRQLKLMPPTALDFVIAHGAPMSRKAHNQKDRISYHV